MSQVVMYPANAGSPLTTTTSETAIDATTIYIAELGNLAAAPNQATLEDGTNFEVVLYSEKSASSGAGTITVTRSGTGHEGTARVWPPGTRIANYPTAYTFDTYKSNIEDLDTRVGALGGGVDITALTAETSIADDDLVIIYDASAEANRKMTKANFVSGLGGGASTGWTQETNFTATPASTSTLTMTSDRTSVIKPGMAVKYTISSVVYYGIVTAITSNLMTIAGASLTGDVTALYYSLAPGQVVQMPILIPGYYEDATDAALLTNDLSQTLIWQQGPAYLVRALMYSRVVDSSSDGYANVRQGAAFASGTAQAGAATTITLASGASASDDYYNNMWIRITSGTGSGQSRKISDYVGSTKAATVATWTTNPSSDSTYEIYKPVITSNSNSGLLLDTTAAKTTVIDVDTSLYGIVFGDQICPMALKGTGGNAQDLSVMLTYVVA